MKINSIQFFRGFAALLVVFHHIMQQFYGFERTNAIGDFFSDFGHFGVDIFFVISGFIMTYTLHGKKVSGIYFLKNRLVRILPAYYIFTLLFLLLTFSNIDSSAYYATIQSVLLSLAFFPHENPAPFLGVYPTLSVGWTLNVEMFFYLVLTVFISIKLRLNQVLVATSCLLLAFPVLFLVLNLDVYKGVAGNWRLFEFVAGIAIAYIYLNFRVAFYSKRLQSLILTVMLTLLYIPIPQVLIDILMSSSLIYFALVYNTILTKFKYFNKLGGYFGNLSYSIYLSHPIVLTLFIKYVDFRMLTFFEKSFILILVVLSIVYISHFSFIFIEKKLSNFFKNFTLNNYTQKTSL